MVVKSFPQLSSYVVSQLPYPIFNDFSLPEAEPQQPLHCVG